MSLNVIIFIGFTLRLTMAIWNGFFGPSPGAELDAIGLHNFASEVANTGNFDEFAIGFVPYTNSLGIIYAATISHIFIGSCLSCAAWYISAIFLKKTFFTYGVPINKTRLALAAYAIWPTSIIFTSITIREPYQLMFVNMALFSFALIWKNGKNKHYLTLIASLFCFSILHGALAAFGILFMILVLFLKYVGDKKIRPWSIGLFGATIILPLIIFGYSMFSDIAYNLDGGLSAAAQNYQVAVLSEDARTNYKANVQISSPFDFLLSIPVGFIQYRLEPLPWRLGGVADFIILAENVFSIYLFLMLLKIKFIYDIKRRRFMLASIFLYFTIEFLWSLGTVNWGTSIRHHIPSLGLLVFACFGTRAIALGRHNSRLSS